MDEACGCKIISVIEFKFPPLDMRRGIKLADLQNRGRVNVRRWKMNVWAAGVNERRRVI